jgi:hypothetical protein
LQVDSCAGSIFVVWLDNSARTQRSWSWMRRNFWWRRWARPDAVRSELVLKKLPKVAGSYVNLDCWIGSWRPRGIFFMAVAWFASVVSYLCSMYHRLYVSSAVFALPIFNDFFRRLT